MTKRRSPGDGSIYPVKEGGYRAVLELGRDPRTGERRRKWFRGKTKRDVRTKLEEARRAFDDGLPALDPKLTVGQFLCSWLDALQNRVSEGTLADYKRKTHCYILVHLEHPFGQSHSARCP